MASVFFPASSHFLAMTPATTGTGGAAPANPGTSTVGPATGGATGTGGAPAGPASTGAAGNATTQQGTAADQPPRRTGGIMDSVMTFLPIIVLFVLMYFFLFRGQRKEEKTRQKMIAEMKKGDEVMTIGGLIGKVVEVREDRVVLKVDESNNVKETYLKSAIQRVLADDGKAGQALKQ